MAAHFTMRSYGVNQKFRLLKAFGYIERVVKSDLFRKLTTLHLTCVTCSELPSYVITMPLAIAA